MSQKRLTTIEDKSTNGQIEQMNVKIEQLKVEYKNTEHMLAEHMLNCSIVYMSDVVLDRSGGNYKVKFPIVKNGDMLL